MTLGTPAGGESDRLGLGISSANQLIHDGTHLISSRMLGLELILDGPELARDRGALRSRAVS